MTAQEVIIPDDLQTHACHSAMWRAVESDDLMLVRQLVNQWCRVDIAKGSVTLRDLALSRGSERIIAIVLGMEATLRLVHAVVENRSEESRLLLEKYGSEINVNFPNMKLMRVTVIFFAIRHGQVDTVRLLLQYGAKLNVSLTLPDQSELPLLLHVLTWPLSAELLSLLLAKAAEYDYLDRLNYKGSTILHYAVEAKVPIERISLLLDYSSPALLCARNQRNLTFIDLAESPTNNRLAQHLLSRHSSVDFASLLECIVSGFDYVWDIFPEQELPAVQLDCARQLERHVYRFVCAVEYADAETVLELTHFQHPESSVQLCMANCRNIADGQPPLHKAVLNQDSRTVRHLCEIIVHRLGIKLDSIRDTFGRTALCYAYALVDANQDSVNLLLDNGSSEFVLDYADRTPLAFREARDHPAMEEFLEFHRAGGYRQSQATEPEVWTVGQRQSVRHSTICYARCCSRSQQSHQEDRSDCDSCDSSVDLETSSSYTCGLL